MSVKTLYPNLKPSLLLDFQNTKALDPRVTFTRTTTAAYYDGKTTTKAEENLFVQSETLNTTWTGTGLSIVANDTTAPNGTTTAEKMVETAIDNEHNRFQFVTTNSSLPYTISVFAKANTRSKLIIRTGLGGANRNCGYDLSAGTVTRTPSGFTCSIVDAGNGWYRCIATVTESTGASRAVGFNITTTDPTNDNAPSYLGDVNESLYLWGAQLEQRSAVTAYTPTTTAPITNYIPTLLTAPAGVARFDHNPTTGESLGLLIEEQRTNLLTYSDDFANAAWTKTRSSITSNIIVAPDGTLTGDKLVEDTTASATHVTTNNTTFAANTTATISVYAKAAERSFVNLRITADGTNFIRCGFNLSSGTAGTPENGGNGSGATATIQSVGNGWYRCILSGIQSSTVANPQGQIFIATGTTSASASYTGDGYSGIYIWGAQLEAGAFPTSYIPTVAATVTRNADVASMTGTNFSSWFNNAEGTLLAQGVIGAALPTGNFGQFFDIRTNGSNRLSLFWNPTTSNNVGLFSAVSGVTQCTTLHSLGAGVQFKLSGAYKVNDFASSLNGGTVQTDTSGTIPTADAAGLGNNGGVVVGQQWIQRIAYYPTRLSNAQLQALTA